MTNDPSALRVYAGKIVTLIDNNGLCRLEYSNSILCREIESTQITNQQKICIIPLQQNDRSKPLNWFFICLFYRLRHYKQFSLFFILFFNALAVHNIKITFGYIESVTSKSDMRTNTFSVLNTTTYRANHVKFVKFRDCCFSNKIEKRNTFHK